MTEIKREVYVKLSMSITFSELNERDETVYECPSEESLHLWYRYLVLNWIQMNHR